MPDAAFQDPFSETAAAYAAYRPTYPAALVDFLAGAAARPELAWDCGCGSGQLSLPLARRFARVIATDASAEQIAQAAPHPNVEYRRAPAQASGLPDAVVDLAAAAQAAHWFDLPPYYAEVRRVGRPGSLVALATYGTVRLDAKIDPVIDEFYGGALAPHWPPGRRYVDDGYRSLPFPFDEVRAPQLEIREHWALAALVGYVGTWSAVRAMEKVEGPAAFRAFRHDLARVWGPEATVRPVRWPLSLRAGRV